MRDLDGLGIVNEPSKNCWMVPVDKTETFVRLLRDLQTQLILADQLEEFGKQPSARHLAKMKVLKNKVEKFLVRIKET